MFDPARIIALLDAVAAMHDGSRLALHLAPDPSEAADTESTVRLWASARHADITRTASFLFVHLDGRDVIALELPVERTETDSEQMWVRTP